MKQYEMPQGSLISFMSNKVKANGGINLAQGIPAFEPPSELLTLLQNLSLDNIHQYAPGRGNGLLLEQLSKHYKTGTDHFLIVNGATEAISLLITYLRYKLAGPFGVLAFKPVYESYSNLSRIFSLSFVEFPLTDDHSVSFSDLASTIKQKNVKLIVVASPGNPLGKIWTKDELDQLMQLADELDFYVILDAVYSDLYFYEAPFYPLNSLNNRWFYVNAFSKLLSITGWRVGYLMALPQLIDEIAGIHDYTGLSSPSVLQQALAFYLEKYNFGKDYTQELRDKLKGNYEQLSNELKLLGFSVFPAQGGYFIWAELPPHLPDGFTFTLDLYEKQKVAIIPGIHFDKQAVRMVRFNIARHPYEISMSVSRIKKYMSEL